MRRIVRAPAEVESTAKLFVAYIDNAAHVSVLHCSRRDAGYARANPNRADFEVSYQRAAKATFHSVTPFAARAGVLALPSQTEAGRRANAALEYLAAPFPPFAIRAAARTLHALLGLYWPHMLYPYTRSNTMVLPNSGRGLCSTLRRPPPGDLSNTADSRCAACDCAEATDCSQSPSRTTIALSGSLSFANATARLNFQLTFSDCTTVNASSGATALSNKPWFRHTEARNCNDCSSPGSNCNARSSPSIASAMHGGIACIAIEALCRSKFASPSSLPKPRRIAELSAKRSCRARMRAMN